MPTLIPSVFSPAYLPEIEVRDSSPFNALVSTTEPSEVNMQYALRVTEFGYLSQYTSSQVPGVPHEEE